ncbi:hypothetical protein M5689_008628 [Euphorbia peplus]|nr:hypothetical protein M5689_008628 [Euphorbia peplus]
MDSSNIILICHLGGKFETAKDESLIYVGGVAHAINFDQRLYEFSALREEVTLLFKRNVYIVDFKYFLPDRRKTLITISHTNDLKVMKKVHIATEKDLNVVNKVPSGFVYIDIYVT